MIVLPRQLALEVLGLITSPSRRPTVTFETQVSNFHRTRVLEPWMRSEERNLRISGEWVQDRDEAPEVPAAVTISELRERRDIMFSGVTGAVVGSNRDGVTSAPSYGLIKDVTIVISELHDALFDVHAVGSTPGRTARRMRGLVQ